jgi:hypothetical protein
MIIIEVFAVFLGGVAFLALCSKGFAYNVAMYTAIAFNTRVDGIDSNDIYSRMPSVLNALWWGLASATSALMCAAFVSHSGVILALALGAIGATVAFTGVRARRLVKDAAREVGVPWPSESQSQ